MNHTKRQEIGIILAILSVAAFQMGTNAISPILADIAAAFPTAGAARVQLLMTFPSLMIILFSILSGLAARRAPKYLLTVLGCSLFALSGILSCLLHSSLTLLFIWAALMGAGIGIAVPVAIGMVSELIQPEHRERVMGWVIAASNLGAMLMTFAGGYLALIHWSMNYLVYLVAVPGVFLSLLFLRKTHGVGNPEASGELQTKTKSSKPSGLLQQRIIWGACVIALLSTMLFNMLPANLSMLVAENGCGTAAQAGTAVSAMLLVGTIAGIFYGSMANRLHNYVMVLAFGLLFLGELLCALGSSYFVILLGCLIAGASQGTNMARALMLAGRHSGGNAAMASAIVTACSNAGGFCTPILTVLSTVITGSSAAAPRFFLGAAVSALTMAVIFAAVRRGFKD